MAHGSHIRSYVSVFKLHNLVFPLRWISAAKATTSVEVLNEFAEQVVQDKLANQNVHNNTKQWHEKIYNNLDRIISANKLNRTKKQIENFEKHKIPQPETSETHSDTLSKCKFEDLTRLLIKNSNCSEEYLVDLITKYSEGSDNRSVEKVIFLREYVRTYYNEIFVRNGRFDHFVSRVYCLRGDARKGLSVMSKAFMENKNMRSSYRTLLRDLINDSVSNRSEASLVTFKNFVIEWSQDMNEHYPLVCLWHSCWSSSWFSNHTMAEELIDTSEPLRKIVADRASALTYAVLVETNEDDAVIRLLQTLLRHKMTEAYQEALQILFKFRIKNRDARGCREILQNSKILGLSLCKNLHNKYIHLVIDGETSEHIQPAKNSSSIKFKF